LPVDLVTRPLRADAARNRARVLQAARDALRELGAEAQMEDVARRAGVGVGTVYRHFPTKVALIEAVMLERTRTLLADARAALEEPEPGEAFCALVRRAAEAQAEDGFCPHDMATLSGSEEAAATFQELKRTTMRLVRRAQREGTLRRDLRLPDVELLFGMVGAAVRASCDVPGQPWRRHVDILVDGLRASGER
jgi:AcrR family transcriptional regulator